jgi:hypothetical protein
MRWTPRRKSMVVISIVQEEITPAKAKKLYHISDEELAAWMRDYEAHGCKGLRATRLRQYNPRPSKPITGADGNRSPDLPIAGIPFYDI